MSNPNRLVTILQLFDNGRPVWTVEQIAKALRLSTSTSYRNVRELVHFAERVALGLAGDLPAASAREDAATLSLPERLGAIEANLIREALEANRGDVKATLEALGIPRKTFYDKLSRYGITRAAYDNG